MTAWNIAFVAGCVAVGGVAGTLVPAWVARLPDPVQPDSNPNAGLDMELDRDLDRESAEAVSGEADHGIGGTGDDGPSPDDRPVSYAELARWPSLPAVAAVATALTWGLLAWRLGPDAALPAVLYLALAGILLGYVDLRVRLLPNAVVLPSYAVVVALLGGAALVTGAWTRLAWALVGGAALWSFLALLGLLAPSGLGFGDVKLAGVLGVGLGWFGLPYVLVGTFAAFVLGGVVSLGLVVAGRAHRKTAIPFGPFLLAGFLLTVMYGEQVLGWYLTR
ncbi:prepilin peptidase [Actinopolymorpha singaporensis]|uniref:Type IV leader peptidase family protein n=1 Tax=Actinopolymorpha singaporensis TaxID=117157 RepID=A0A1H1VIK4_9ACTN|nr:A24 family peptidase [Actinopolymorpha singaporensis]SDS84582.1 Type IV leader peptidase family protein [Actinopolymorpha singaporensis]